ncbi:helix-turn-helix domain-containing protein [Streptomyces sp. DK15]|uniref:helix-turn-helix domain-containing protein n=1 Tax=Streptomyces sp. DK15 TaxID=2957499 RepID=UPI0029B62766|nr:helix-turn-helix domain-containing protein [Streptomyces sp. DK15]MDX2393507.1 helix-turn-helix domain-containing protein [Streptomyces sp. DK15]
MRLQAAGLFAEGVKPPEVARRLRVTSRSTYQWHQVWTRGGAAALASRGAGGRRCKLAGLCLAKPAEFLEQGPAARGWVEDQVWTGSRVATPIDRNLLRPTTTPGPPG